MASVVSSSHLPVGVPANEPFLASAVWISFTRSLLGAFCPGCLRERREELFFEAVLPGCAAVFPEAVLALGPFGAGLAPADVFFLAGLLAAVAPVCEWPDCAKLAGTPGPAAASSKARSAGRRFRMGCRLYAFSVRLGYRLFVLSATPIAGFPPEPRRAG